MFFLLLDADFCAQHFLEYSSWENNASSYEGIFAVEENFFIKIEEITVEVSSLLTFMSEIA